MAQLHKGEGEVEPRKYGHHQVDIYRRGVLEDRLPVVTTDPNKLESQAKEHLSAKSFSYVAGGAGERATMDANRLAFRQWKIISRMLRASTNRDLSTTLFGLKLEAPIIMAPIGVHSIFHHDREIVAAQVATELGIPYTHSTAASSSIEECAKANGDGLRFYQLYWPHDDEITLSLLKRAKENGYKALVVTLDTWALGWRPADLDLAYVPFVLGIGNQVGFTDPVLRRKFKEATGQEVEENIPAASQFWEKKVFPGKNHAWEDLKLLKDNWDGPIILKGIQHVEDAKLAVEHGADGIVVSNHGGRQLDGAIGSLDMLPEIVEAVGDKLTVLFDSGIRTGGDVIKALSLGAKGVLIGRPYIYGLAINGKQGGKAALLSILADLDQSMGLAGICSLSDCNRTVVRRVQYPGDRFSSN